MNSQQLSRRAQDLQVRADSSRKEAERHNFKADDYEKNGDETRAAIERQTAERLTEEADAYASEAEQLHETSLDMDVQSKALEAEKAAVEAEYKSKIDDIEKRMNRLTGGL